jgi:hypothetical protein
MSDPRWTQVDDYVAGKLLKPDPALDAALAKDDRITATAMQTVGAKKWDGFVMAVVK